MRKVQFKAIMANPGWTAKPGELRVLEDAEAQAFVEAGVAEYVGPPIRVPVLPPPPHTAPPAQLEEEAAAVSAQGSSPDSDEAPAGKKRKKN